jgi:lipopolysaccharide/colanic/teichoic acid biosynthesis glycosyltransferase
MLGLLLASPILVLVAAFVKLTSWGPVLFRQKRLGREGAEFELLKFRTMIRDRPVPGPGLTRQGDARVTRVGRVMRACKLDELPQLWNVLRGEMSLVGPRPELAEYIARLRPDQLCAFDLLPGITSPASLKFRREEQLLAKIPPEQLSRFYCQELLPRKVQLDIDYGRTAGPIEDLKLIARTALSVLRD